MGDSCGATATRDQRKYQKWAALFAAAMACILTGYSSSQSARAGETVEFHHLVAAARADTRQDDPTPRAVAARRTAYP